MSGLEVQESGVSGTDGLVPVFYGEIAGATVPLVDARALHGFLGVKRDFSNWIKHRLGKYGFIEGQDYSQVLDLKARQNWRGLKSTTCVGDKVEYHLTLGMAKELAMVENNAKGREARQYFIGCERRLHEDRAEQSALQEDTRQMFASYLSDTIDCHTVATERMLVTLYTRLYRAFDDRFTTRDKVSMAMGLFRSYMHDVTVKVSAFRDALPGDLPPDQADAKVGDFIRHWTPPIVQKDGPP